MKDSAGRYVYVNDRFETLFQIRSDDLLGNSDLKWLSPDIAEHVRENDLFVLQTQKTVELLEVVPTPDGVMRDWMVVKFPYTSPSGEKFVGGVAMDVTSQKDAEREIRRLHDDLEMLFDHSPDVIVRFDRNYRHLYANRALEVATRVPVEQFIGRTSREVGAPPDFCDKWEAVLREVFESGENRELEFTVESWRGPRSHQACLTPEHDSEGNVQSVVVVSRDITARINAEAQLRRSEKLFRELIESSPGFVCTHDEKGTLLSVNASAARAIGIPAEQLIGRYMGEMIPPENKAGFQAYLKRVWEKGSDDGVMEVYNLSRQKRIWKYHNVKLDRAADDPFILGYAQDITDLKDSEDYLRTLSMTDDLTRLYNRRGFLIHGERELKATRSRPDGRSLYMVFADLDGLKAINDEFGHDQGSAAIVQMADILMDSFRGSDIVARLGGDEYAILMTSASEQTEEIINARLQQKIAAYNAASTKPYDLALSIGVYKIDPGKEHVLDELLREADRRMYEQKRLRKSGKQET
jgi:diguanylate cyclase (GGDEF)-like protein/PAS domain S-box-containing protein